MHRNIKSLIGYSIRATDGEIGEVEEFYFDDNTWDIRYLIVKTGTWLFGRSVLIAPVALQSIDWGREDFLANITKHQISNSPDTDFHKPVSHQHEIALYEHYTWQPYWSSEFYAGGQWSVMPAAPLFDERIAKDNENAPVQKENNRVHLRSTERIAGYHIHASDGEIGHVNDFIIDDESWKVISIVVDTNNWIGGKKVMLSVQHIKEISWEKSQVMTDLSKVAVKAGELFVYANYDLPANASVPRQRVDEGIL
ncbi:MAG: PRC-barrel domain-containing protein [Bacteroidota bacterium]